MFGRSKGTSQLDGGCDFLGIWTTEQLPERVLQILLYIYTCFVCYFLNHFCTFPCCDVVLRLSCLQIISLITLLLQEAVVNLNFISSVTHAAWLMGSWSGHTELLITGTPLLSLPSSSLSCTHPQFLHGWGNRKAFFPLTAVCDSCRKTKAPRGWGASYSVLIICTANTQHTTNISGVILKSKT